MAWPLFFQDQGLALVTKWRKRVPTDHRPSKRQKWSGVSVGKTYFISPLQYTSFYCKPIDGQEDVVRSARVPLLYPCRNAREKLSVRESDRRCPPLAFCPKRISVGRAHHHRKRMHSIPRFRTKLTFRRNILLYSIFC